MYNAFTESRLATYDALGRMKQLQPSVNCILQYSSLRNLITNNAQFCAQLFNTYPYLDRYMNTIIRVAIYNATTIIVVFSEDNLYLSANGTVQYAGTTTTSSALYRIENSSQDSTCKYTATYISSSPIVLPPKEYMRAMSSNTHILYGTGYANILDDLNIKNTYTYIDIDPLSRGILNLILAHEDARNKTINTFIRAQKISCNEILYAVEYSLGNTDIVLSTFKKDGNVAVIDNVSTYYTDTSNLISPTQIIREFYTSSDNLSTSITRDMIIMGSIPAASIDKLNSYFIGHAEGFAVTTDTDADIFKQGLLKEIGVLQTPTDYRYRYIDRGRSRVWKLRVCIES
jgi:hypothetical protein